MRSPFFQKLDQLLRAIDAALAPPPRGPRSDPEPLTSTPKPINRAIGPRRNDDRIPYKIGTANERMEGGTMGDLYERDRAALPADLDDVIVQVVREGRTSHDGSKRAQRGGPREIGDLIWPVYDHYSAELVMVPLVLIAERVRSLAEDGKRLEVWTTRDGKPWSVRVPLELA